MASISKEQRNLNRKRYRLHVRVRKQGYTVKARERILFVPALLVDEMSKQVKRLSAEFNYTLQTTIV